MKKKVLFLLGCLMFWSGTVLSEVLSIYVNGMATSQIDAEEQHEVLIQKVRSHKNMYLPAKNFNPVLHYSPTRGRAIDAANIVLFDEMLDRCYLEGVNFSYYEDQMNCNLYRFFVAASKYYPKYFNKEIQFIAYSRGNILVQKAIETALNETGERFN